MRSVYLLLGFCLLALVCANDPSPLQDFCIPPKDLKSAVLVKGQYCKDPAHVTADDFFSSRLKYGGDTSNIVGVSITPIFIDEFPALHSAGIAMSRVDFAKGGANPPHLHPRASEIFTVIEGTLLAGFVTTNPDNKYYYKELSAGDTFVFPVGLIHFQLNIGTGSAKAIAAFSSQNPGVVTIANSIFNSKPFIQDEVLRKSFLVEKKEEVTVFHEKKWVHIINFG